MKKSDDNPDLAGPLLYLDLLLKDLEVILKL